MQRQRRADRAKPERLDGEAATAGKDRRIVITDAEGHRELIDSHNLLDYEALDVVRGALQGFCLVVL